MVAMGRETPQLPVSGFQGLSWQAQNHCWPGEFGSRTQLSLAECGALSVGSIYWVPVGHTIDTFIFWGGGGVAEGSWG